MRIKYAEHNDAIKNKIRYFNWTPHWQSGNKMRNRVEHKKMAIKTTGSEKLYKKMYRSYYIKPDFSR